MSRERSISEILPVGIEVCEILNDLEPELLYPEEANCVKNAGLKRRKEFQLSRTCARRALKKLGISPRPLLPSRDRDPIWPKGIVGSITHCDSYTAVAVGSRATWLTIGIDAEPNQPLPYGALEFVASNSEQVAIRKLGPSSIHWDRLMFSAKESVFKAWFPITRQWIDFLDAKLDIFPDTSTFQAEIAVKNQRLGNLLTGQFLSTGKHLLTSITLSAAIP